MPIKSSALKGIIDPAKNAERNNPQYPYVDQVSISRQRYVF